MRQLQRVNKWVVARGSGQNHRQYSLREGWPGWVACKIPEWYSRQRWSTIPVQPGSTSEIVWRWSWWSWSIDAWTAGHLSTSPFTVSHCPAKDISIPLSGMYCICHVIDSTRTAARLLPLLVCPPGTVFRTLSTIPNSAEAAFRHLIKTFLFAPVLAHPAH